MRTSDLLTESFERVRATVHDALDGLSVDDLAWRPDGGANPIAWLVWHLTRVQDDHLAEVAGHEQVWTADGWAARFGLPFPDEATGYGMDGDEVARVRADAGLLLGYHDAVHSATVRWVGGLSDADLDRVVDEDWDPPVTLGVRLVSVVNDDTQHCGQIGYVRGLLDRR